VYSSAQIDAILARYSIDLIQLPVNVLDQRLLRSGHFARLRDAGIEIHARSVFLQGLLLMEPADLSEKFASVREHLTRYHAAIAEAGLTAVEAALGFVASLREIGCVLAGVVTAEQLEQAALAIAKSKVVAEDFRRFAWSDEFILDPSRWNRVPAEGAPHKGSQK
jgi:aryl-alcohol dehydrogenase-like predicted oxidoreductase